MKPIRNIVLGLLPLFFLACSDSSDPGPTDPGTGAPSVYHVTYHANGADSGSVPLDETEYETGETATVAAPGTLALADHSFTEWNTQSDGTGTSYAPGASLTMSVVDCELYARWEDNTVQGWNPALGSWAYVEGGEDLSGAAIDYCRLVLDANDHPIAAYSLTATQGMEPKQQVARWNGAAFDDLGGSDVLLWNVRSLFDLVCDDSDQVWISTTDDDDNGQIVRYSGSAWAAPVEFTSDQYTFSTSLTLNSAGHPVMAFRHRPGEDTLLGIRTWTGSAWTSYSEADFTTSLQNRTSIAMIGETPYVMFANSMQFGQVIRNPNDAGWEYVGPSPMHDSNSVKSYMIKAGPQGRPWVIFRQGGDVFVGSFDGTEWTLLDTEVFENFVDTSSMLQTMDLVFVGEIPVITFVSRLAPRGIRVLAWVNNAWVPLADDALVGSNSSGYPQLAAAADGRIFLGYRDAAAEYGMSVKVYTPGS